jgi:DNA-binding NtrC family response regulator
MKKSILYLDDDSLQLEVFEQMFGAEYDVRVAASREEALAALKECPADIIISDQVMPDVKGTEFLSEVARLCPASARVLLTGRITVGEVLTEVGSGVVHLFLAKPWAEDEMRSALERAAAVAGDSAKPRRGGKGGA